MTTNNNFFFRLYKKAIIDHPLLAIIAVILLTIVAATQLPKFRLDASGESLTLENDTSIDYYRQVNKNYSSDDFLIITWQPNKGLMDPDALSKLKALTTELHKIDTVESVNSILNVPLLDGITLDAEALSDPIPTLSEPNVDKQKALEEFTTSPIYKNLLVGEEGDTSSIQINFLRDAQYFSLLDARDTLRKLRVESPLSSEQSKQLRKLESDFDAYSRITSNRTRVIIGEVRDIMDNYRQDATLYLGGISMITNDMLDYIEYDITVFGVGILLFIMLALFAFFSQLRWVILPLFACLSTVVILSGLLAFLDWRITVISSNFPSILLIVTLALSIHLVVFYRDYISQHPNTKVKDRIIMTVTRLFWPCLYTALTTIVAFSSLLISGIRPVIDFGWIMTIGIALGFVLTFIIFPSLLQLMKTDQHQSGTSITYKVTNWICNFTIKFKPAVFITSFLVVLFSLYGITQLKVENSFIDYFKSNTEINQGMQVIDKKLGGTTPLDIVIDADLEEIKLAAEKLSEDDFFDEDDDFDDEFASEEYDAGYWFNVNKLKQLENIQDYIDGLPVTGKVQSLATTAKILKQMNGGSYPDQLTLTLTHQKLPESVKKPLLRPYLSEDGNQTRINIRVEETNPALVRGKLIQEISDYIVNEVGIKQENVHFTGMLVLYNNMLDSLFNSQILTIGAVYLAILIMFMILFRSFYVALLASIPNVLSAGFILGIMGVFGIPMDMMTITIAAIVIGIGVDDTIHYVHRFKTEFKKDGVYLETMKRCHGTIGKAIYYTSVTVIAGFSILALSNFIPSIYFGLLTGLAMGIALLFNLTLLPLMLITFKPLKKQKYA